MGAFLLFFLEIIFCMIRREYHPSSKIDALILKKKLEDGTKVGGEESCYPEVCGRRGRTVKVSGPCHGRVTVALNIDCSLERDEALHESNGDITTVEQLDVEDHVVVD